jgi:hypothetical protein
VANSKGLNFDAELFGCHLISDKSRETPCPLLMFFHTSTPKNLTNSLEHHPPHILSYLTSTTNIHNASLPVAKRHNHFLKRAWLNKIRFLTPKPPKEIKSTNLRPIDLMEFKLVIESTPKKSR